MSTDLIEASSFQEKFPVLVSGSEQNKVVAANVAGEVIEVGDLDRIKVPTGGATTWTVVGIDGEKSEKALEGVIIHVARRRAYWEDNNPTGEQPDCASLDCTTGVGDPGGACLECPLNQWGSAVKQDGSHGRGKACKETALLFLLRPDSNLPEIVSVPPGSLKPVKQYRLRLKVPYWGCITRLELTAVTNKDGIKFAQIAPSFVGTLGAGAARMAKEYADTLAGTFQEVEVDREEVEE